MERVLYTVKVNLGNSDWKQGNPKNYVKGKSNNYKIFLQQLCFNTFEGTDIREIYLKNINCQNIIKGKIKL